MLEHECADLGSQGHGRGAAVLAVEGLEFSQEIIPRDGGGEALERAARVEDELGKGQVRELRLGAISNEHGIEPPHAAGPSPAPCPTRRKRSSPELRLASKTELDGRKLCPGALR